jgi:hypothetical protein
MDCFVPRNDGAGAQWQGWGAMTGLGRDDRASAQWRGAGWQWRPPHHCEARSDTPLRHCEARSAVAIHVFVRERRWIASFLAMTQLGRYDKAGAQ